MFQVSKVWPSLFYNYYRLLYIITLESHYIRVPRNNYETWMQIINSSYPQGMEMPTSRMVVCDLHFNKDDILNINEQRSLAKNAMPIVL